MRFAIIIVFTVLLAIPVGAQVEDREKTLCLPDYCGSFSHAPHYYGFNRWNIHEGLNASFGTSISGTWSDSKYLGTGFSQDVSLLYAMPLSKRVSLVLGGYAGNTQFSGDSYCNAGVRAVLGYRLNEHWEAYLYAQKSIVNTMPRFPLDYEINGDCVGAALKYNFNPSASIQLNVEVYDRPVWWSSGRGLGRLKMDNYGAPPPPKDN